MDFFELEFELPLFATNSVANVDIKNSPNLRPGRPRRDPVDRFKTQAWFDFISSLEGLSAYKLEEKFDGDQFVREGGFVSRPKKWDRYRRGDSSPNKDQVVKVARELPDSKQLIQHPLWDILRQRPPTVETIIDYLRPINPTLTQLLMALTGLSMDLPRRHFLIRSVNSLWRSASIDSLTALVGAFRVGLAAKDTSLTVSVSEPMLSVALHQAAFGNLGYESNLFYEYMLILHDSEPSMVRQFSKPTESDFLQTVNRLRELERLILMQRRSTLEARKLISTLSYVLCKYGILNMRQCKFKKTSQYVVKKQLSDNKLLLDYLIPRLEPKKRSSTEDWI